MSLFLLISPISVAEQMSMALWGWKHYAYMYFKSPSFKRFYFIIVGCEQLPLIFAELKILIPDARQAYTSQTQTHTTMQREQ